MWFGFFINSTLMAAKGASPNGCASYFQVLDNHTLQPYTFDCSYLQHFRSAPVRVVAKIGKKWMLDPSPLIAHMWFGCFINGTLMVVKGVHLTGALLIFRS